MGNSISGYSVGSLSMQKGEVVPAATANDMSGGFGLCSEVTERDSAASSVSVGSTLGISYNQPTDGTLNADVDIFSAPASLEPSLNVCLESLTAISATTSMRVFIGLTNGADIHQSENPSSAHIGFGYDTGLGDSNWYVVSDTTGGGSQARVDTGVPVTDSSAGRRFKIGTTDAGTSWDWEILDKLGTSILSGNVAADLPTASTELFYSAGMRALAASARTLFHSGFKLEQMR